MTVYLGDDYDHNDDRYELEIGTAQIIYNPSSELPNSRATREMKYSPILKGSLTYVPYEYIGYILNHEKWNISYSIYDKNGNKTPLPYDTDA